VSINEEIIISKDEIFRRYTNLNSYTQDIINKLYGERINNIDILNFLSSNIINLDGSNNIQMLNSYQDKTGVYIFLNEENIPVYIGVAGKRNSNHSIKDRLQKQFNCNTSNSTLSKNISDIESLCGNSLRNVLKQDRKQLILDYAPKLIVINVGNLSCIDDVNKSLALEQILISIFNSKYNK